MFEMFPSTNTPHSDDQHHCWAHAELVDKLDEVFSDFWQRLQDQNGCSTETFVFGGRGGR